MRSLWPVSTPGSPGKPKPATLYGHAAPTVRQCSPCWYQTLGICGPRCGSLARIASPVALLSLPTAQEFEPMPLPLGPMSASTASAPFFTALNAATMRASTRGDVEAA